MDKLINMKELYIKALVKEECKMAAYHITNEKAEIVELFVYDHKINQKYQFFNNIAFEISDISYCGNKILTINKSYAKKERKTKIFDIHSGDVLFDTTDFFGYEAIFTPINNLIICRGDIKSKSDKCFVYDIEKKEVVHIMTGGFCLSYGGFDKYNKNFIYPNSKKKDEIVSLNLNTLEERIILLKEKCTVQTVIPLKKGGYLAINAKMNALKIDDTGNLVWKRKLDFDKFYFAPDCFEFENEIIFNKYEHIRLNLETGEIIEKDKRVKGGLSKYFGNMAIPFGEYFKVIDLKTREVSDFDISQFNTVE